MASGRNAEVYCIGPGTVGAVSHWLGEQGLFLAGGKQAKGVFLFSIGGTDSIDVGDVDAATPQWIKAHTQVQGRGRTESVALRRALDSLASLQSKVVNPVQVYPENVLEFGPRRTA